MTSAAEMREQLLCSPEWLANQTDSDVRIIDCCSREAYRRGHIPGAARLPCHLYVKDEESNTMFSAMEFEAIASECGIGPRTTVIAYDDYDSLWATRLWWVLRYFGHDNVKVLDGGWHGWLAAKGKVATDPVKIEAGSFSARPQPGLMCDLQYLRAHYDSDDVQVLDVRTAGEYAGDDQRGNKRGGHVPGAIHIEWRTMMTDDHQFLPEKELSTLLESKGLDKTKEILTHCQAGIRGAHGAFTLTLSGFGEVRNYDASMKEWANEADTPLE
jgi:thiosulfate/3-mercaptopyruvate sulfurtransferase